MKGRFGVIWRDGDGPIQLEECATGKEAMARAKDLVDSYMGKEMREVTLVELSMRWQVKRPVKGLTGGGKA